GQPGGLNNNPDVRIELPGKLGKAAKLMKQFGMGAQVDQLEASMNRAAEAAVPQAQGLLEVGGTVEDAAKGQSSVNAGVPLFIVVVLSLLMVQLRSFSRMAMVFLTAPLGLIGVTLVRRLFRQPFGVLA
ncbi:DUF4197 family protein, partial [Pseudomonas aeruginosa]